MLSLFESDCSTRTDHFLSHEHEHFLVRFLRLAQHLSKAREQIRVFARTAPLYIISGCVLWKFREYGWFLPFVKQLVHRNFQRSRQLLKSFNRRNCVSILDAREIAAKQTCSLFDFTLREILPLA